MELPYEDTCAKVQRMEGIGCAFAMSLVYIGR